MAYQKKAINYLSKNLKKLKLQEEDFDIFEFENESLKEKILTSLYEPFLSNIKENKFDNIFEINDNMNELTKLLEDYENKKRKAEGYESFLFDNTLGRFKKATYSTMSLNELTDKIEELRERLNSYRIYDKDQYFDQYFINKDNKNVLETFESYLEENYGDYNFEFYYFSYLVPLILSQKGYNDVLLEMLVYNFIYYEIDMYTSIIRPFMQWIVMADDELTKVKIKNTELNMKDYYLKIIKMAINISTSDHKSFKNFNSDIINYIFYFKNISKELFTFMLKNGSLNICMLFIFNKYYEELKEEIYKLYRVTVDDFDGEDISNILNKFSVFEYSKLLDKSVSHRMIEKLNFEDKHEKIKNYPIVSYYKTHFSSLTQFANKYFADYLEENFIKPNEIAKGVLNLKTANEFYINIFLDYSSSIKYRKYDNIIRRYFENITEISKKEYETFLFIKWFINQGVDSLARLNNNKNSEFQLSEQEVEELTEYCIYISSKKLFSKRRSNDFSKLNISVNNLISPLIKSITFNDASKLNYINNIVSFDLIPAKPTKQNTFNSLFEYFENRLKVKTLLDLEIDIDTDFITDKNRIGKMYKNLMEKNVNGSFDKNSRVNYHDYNYFVLFDEDGNIREIDINEFFESLGDYLEHYFKGMKHKVRKQYKNLLIKNLFE